jgi:hypothetical protein
MAVPGTGPLSTNIIVDELGYPLNTQHQMAGGATPVVNSMAYIFRPGNVATSGVSQTPDFTFNEFRNQQAIYKCVSFTGGTGGGTATIVEYVNQTRSISVAQGVRNRYCVRRNYDGNMAISSVSNLTYTVGNDCHGVASAGNSQLVNDNAWGLYGVRLYSSFNLDGSPISATNYYTPALGGPYGTGTYWSNPNGNSTDGRMNYVGIWSSFLYPPTSAVPWGTGSITVSVDAPTTKTYYFGIGSDNHIHVSLNNTYIIKHPKDSINVDNFRLWHIYPISLTQGINVFKFQVMNEFGASGTKGGIAFEIYNNTSAELASSITAQPVGQTKPASINLMATSRQYQGAGIIGPFFNSTEAECLMLDYTPTPTPTPTRTPTPVPTNTPTPTPTPVIYSVNFYARMDISIADSFKVQYTGGTVTTWTDVAGLNIGSTTCNFHGFINVVAGTSIVFRVVDSSGIQHKLNAATSAVCPTPPLVSPVCTGFAGNIQSNRNIAITFDALGVQGGC